MLQCDKLILRIFSLSKDLRFDELHKFFWGGGKRRFYE